MCNEGFEGNICKGDTDELHEPLVVICIVFLLSDISCPGGQTPCNGNGVCDLTTGVCACNEGNQGSDCSGNHYHILCHNNVKIKIKVSLLQS